MATSARQTLLGRVARLALPRTSASTFHVADRAVVWVLGGVSIASAWFWVFAFMVGPQVAYLDGWPKLAIFAGANVLGLSLVCWLAHLVRKRMDGEGVTLPEFHERTYDVRVRVVGAFAILMVQGVYAVLAQVIGARILLTTVTALDPFVMGLLITAGVVAIALWASRRGLPNSLRADALKAVLILAIALPAAAILFFGGEAVVQGFQGVRATPLSLFEGSLWRDYAFGLTLSLIAGASIDQQLYQRAYALSAKGAGKALVLAPIVFAVLALGAGALGFIAASWGLEVKDPQTVLFITLANAFPAGLWVPLNLAVAFVLIATAAAALNAVASVGANDFVKTVRPRTSDAGLVWASRGTMALFVAICLAVYWLRPNIQLLELLLFVGAFRGAMLLPTVLGALTAPKRAPIILPYAIALAMFAGVWVAIGMWPLYPLRFDTFWGGIAALAISGAGCLVELILTRTRVPKPAR